MLRWPIFQPASSPAVGKIAYCRVRQDRQCVRMRFDHDEMRAGRHLRLMDHFSYPYRELAHGARAEAGSCRRHDSRARVIKRHTHLANGGGFDRVMARRTECRRPLVR